MGSAQRWKGFAVVCAAGCAVAALWWTTREASRGSAADARATPDARAARQPPGPAEPAATATAAPTAPAAALDPLLEELAPQTPQPDWIDADGQPTRSLVHASLERALREHHPRYKLSEDDVERATDAVLRLREARLALAELPQTPEVSDERRALVEEVAAAGAAFAEAVDMGLDEFTEGAGGGIDRFDPREPLPEAEFLDEAR